MKKRNKTMLTCGHQIKDQLDIGDVGATRGRTADPCALDRVRAGYLVPGERDMAELCLRDRAPVEHPGGHAREDEEEEREELEVDVVVIFKKSFVE